MGGNKSTIFLFGARRHRDDPATIVCAIGFFRHHRRVAYDDGSYPTARDHRRAPRCIAATASPPKPVRGTRFRDSRGNSKNLPRKSIVKGVRSRRGVVSARPGHLAGVALEPPGAHDQARRSPGGRRTGRPGSAVLRGRRRRREPGGDARSAASCRRAARAQRSPRAWPDGDPGRARPARSGDPRDALSHGGRVPVLCAARAAA